MTNKVIYLGNSKNPKYNTGFAYGVWSSLGIGPALTCMGGGNREPSFLIEYEL